jgi:hypothetical protein
VCMLLMTFLKNCLQLRILEVFQCRYFLTSSTEVLERNWNIMRDCVAEKWVHLFGLSWMKGKRSSELGLVCVWENSESM